jgi:hypothetical protein
MTMDEELTARRKLVLTQRRGHKFRGFDDSVHRVRLTEDIQRVSEDVIDADDNGYTDERLDDQI